ncbi:MAG: hypothetical protein KAG61_03805 [Bacteriovoracaceae bacterium]|nr:hypothetical protein [Bacteriovoracaceae bacterium]
MKRVLANVLIILSIFAVSVCAVAKDENGSNSNDGKRSYTESEFHAAVVKEVNKRMIKLGRKEIVNFSRELLEKEHKLSLREMSIEKKKQEVSLSGKGLNKKIGKFQERQSKLLACLNEVDKKKKKRIQHMVDTISGMRPNTAAEVLSVQDAEISVQILGLLDSAKVSKIFNQMDKEISARLQKQYMTMKK